jgi:hypothetical protein
LIEKEKNIVKDFIKIKNGSWEIIKFFFL